MAILTAISLKSGFQNMFQQLIRQASLQIQFDLCAKWHFLSWADIVRQYSYFLACIYSRAVLQVTLNPISILAQFNPFAHDQCTHSL